jgi:hypothetical protein
MGSVNGVCLGDPVDFRCNHSRSPCNACGGVKSCTNNIDRQIRPWGAVGAPNLVLLEATITAAWGSQRNTGTPPQWGGSGHLGSLIGQAVPES